MKRHDKKDASGLFLGSEPLDGGAHERKAMGDRDGKDLGGKGPKDSGDDDSSDKGDSDSSDKGIPTRAIRAIPTAATKVTAETIRATRTGRTDWVRRSEVMCSTCGLC